MPLLRVAVLANGEARIINTASQAHQMIGDMVWDDLQLEKGYHSWKAYAQSKLANILFTRELARRELGNHLLVNAVHPGVVDTNFPAGGGLLAKAGWFLMKPFTKTPDQGADTILWLATEKRRAQPGAIMRSAGLHRCQGSGEPGRRPAALGHKSADRRRGPLKPTVTKQGSLPKAAPLARSSHLLAG